MAKFKRKGLDPKQAKLQLEANAKRLRTRLKRFKPTKKVYVGLPSDSGTYDSGESIVAIGAVHEFGSISNNIPERSFLREPLSRNSEAIRAKADEEARKAFASGLSADSALEPLGELGISISVDSFTNNDWSPIQTRSDGSSTPLLHTGTLRRSITKVIR